MTMLNLFNEIQSYISIWTKEPWHQKHNISLFLPKYFDFIQKYESQLIDIELMILFVLTKFIYHLLSLVPGRCSSNFQSVISEHMLLIKFMRTLEISVRWMPQNTFDDKSTNGSGNGLVPSGIKPLPERMVTNICVAIWCH